jgi:hypothetical protein
VSLVKDKNQSHEKKDQQYSNDVLKSFLAFSFHMAVKSPHI